MKISLKNYNEESDEEYFVEVDVQYLENLHELHNNLSFLHEKLHKFNRNALLKTFIDINTAAKKAKNDL